MGTSPIGETVANKPLLSEMLNVLCPKCKAAKGQFCITKFGKDAPVAHKARRIVFREALKGKKNG